MVENTQNSFEKYIGFFIFYILSLNYVTFMGQILIFESSWIQNTIVSTLFMTNYIFFFFFFKINFKNVWENRYIGSHFNFFDI